MKQRLTQLQTQNLKQLQKLILSPQMQQALHLLQLPVLELSSVIAEEVESNPLLECEEEVYLINEKCRMQNGREEEDLKSFIENTLAVETSLYNHLMNQAKETFTNDNSLCIAETLIGQLDNRGFLTASMEEMAQISSCDLASLETILLKLQEFDPPGVGARSLQECFLIQLRRLGREKSLAYKIVALHFEEMIQNKIPNISRSLRQSAEKIRDTIERVIKTLDPNPGANHAKGHYRTVPNYLVPDVTIKMSESQFLIEINEEALPHLRLNQNYLKMLSSEDLTEELRSYIQEKIASGKWLLRNLYERHQTLYRIAEQIVIKQARFLANPNGHLCPLTMKEVAEKVELHESTVARAVANKYVNCPRGIIPLRSFFTHAYTTEQGENISATSIKDLLKEILAKEDRHSPLSDEMISKMIKEKGIPCARRTITKYRLELGFGNTAQRKIH